MRRVVFAIPGALGTPTGGYAYDRRLIVELRDLGWAVDHLALPDGFPAPSAEARAEAVAAFEALGAGETVLVDGLALGALPEVAEAEAGRLHLVALVHHPLGDEAGLEAGARGALIASERAALAHVRAVICTSPATAARLASAFGVAEARISVAPPGTDPASRAAGDGDPPLIVSIGSLIPRKRHDVLIEALARIADRPWRARIVGSPALDPACAADLRARVAAAGLADRITFTGSVADPRSVLAEADIFALASEYEGYGMAFAEALSQGLPVVACASPAVSALVPDEAGAVVAAGDPAAFAAALAGLVDDRRRRRACAEAAWCAGRALPSWRDSAAIVAGVLEAAR